MTASWIKNSYQKNVWERRAIPLAKKKVGKMDHPLKWRYAHGIFNRLMAGITPNQPIKEETELEDFNEEVDLSSLNETLITSLEEQELYENIHQYITNHPVYNTSSEEEMYESIENIYLEYKNHEIKPEIEDKDEYLCEFVNSYMTRGYVGSTLGMTNPMGGARTEKPKGPYVYGQPESQGTLNNAFMNPKNAKVVIPDKKSNYEPWNYVLNTQDDVINDVEKSKKFGSINHDEQLPEDNISPSTGSSEENFNELVSVLTDVLGVKKEDLSKMSPEQFEDTIRKSINSELKNKKSQQEKVAVASTKSIPGKLTEAFGLDSEQILDEGVKGKTWIARNILIKKFKKKEAMEKGPDGRTFIMDRYDIARTMLKFGYVFDSKSNSWVKQHKKWKSPKHIDYVDPTSKKSIIEPENKKNVYQLPADERKDISIDAKNVDKKSIDTTPVEKSQPIESDYNPLHDLNMKKRIKSMECRLILTVAHEDELASKFNIDEETEELIPEISDEDLFAKMDLLKYIWNESSLLWLSSNSMSLPQILFNQEENNKSVVARAILAAVNDDIEYITIDQNGKLKGDIETIYNKMEKQDFSYDDDLSQWIYTDEDEKESINESIILYEANNFFDYRSNLDIHKRGFDINTYKIMQGRYLLKFLIISKMVQILHNNLDIADTNNYTPLVLADPTILSESDKNIKQDFINVIMFLKQRQNIPNSKFNPHNKTGIIENSKVISLLESNGYEFSYKISNNNVIPMWIEKGINKLPTIFSTFAPYDETIESYTAKGILSSLLKSQEPILINWKKYGTNQVEFTYVEPKKVISQLEQEHFKWIDDNGITYGWVKFNIEDQYKKFLSKYANVNWDSMNSEIRKQYKLIKSKESLGMIGKDPEHDWSSDPNEQKKLINLLDKEHDWDIETKSWKVDPNRHLIKKSFRELIKKIKDASSMKNLYNSITKSAAYLGTETGKSVVGFLKSQG